MNNRILLVEDDTTLSMIIAETLQRYGFDVATADNGEKGLSHFVKNGADLIIADVMMPKMDGFTLGRKIRQINRDVPLLYLTAKSNINDIVEGFETGGNDYLKKPFQMMELIMRIKALLRKNIAAGDTIYTIGRYILNLSTQTLEYPGIFSTKLSFIETKILKELCINVGHTVEADTLMKLVWQRDDLYSRNSLHGFIQKIRHYLRHDPNIVLLNQRGIGYMLTIINPPLIKN